MPAEQRGWLDDHQSAAPVEQTGELGQHESISRRCRHRFFLSLLLVCFGYHCFLASVNYHGVRRTKWSAPFDYSVRYFRLFAYFCCNSR
jgi:hypothetical protein